MPQARKPSDAKGSARTSSRASGSRSGAGARSSASPPRSSAGRSAGNGASRSDSRADATAERLRKLNERIIEAGKGAGETTLAAYEKALKAIAASIERGPGKSDVEWVSHLATTQAKFIRDVTEAWTSAARKMLE